MTVTTELAKTAANLDLVLCIEGLGYPDDPWDFSQTFSGTVFSTTDDTATLATALGCTVSGGLALPSAISDEIDIETMEYKPGGMTFEVDDIDDVLLGAYRVLTRGTPNHLNADLSYGGTTIEIDEVNFNSVNAATVYLGGSEAVMLHNRAAVGGTVYSYTACERAQLGTRRGCFDLATAINHGDFRWDNGSYVWAYNPRWIGRKILLLAHVPGEARDNCFRMYQGTIADMRSGNAGQRWVFETVADLRGFASRDYVSPGGSEVRTAKLVSRDGVLFPNFDASQSVSGLNAATYGSLPSDFNTRIRLSIPASPPMDKWGPAFGFAYRNSCSGGTAGVKVAVSAGVPQAYTTTIDGGVYYAYQAPIRIDGKLVLGRHLPSGKAYLTLDVERNALGDTTTEVTAERGSAVGFPIACYGQNYVTNRWMIDRGFATHPINTILSLLTTMPGEYQIADAVAGGTTSRIDFAAATFTAAQWDGFTVYCVEGDNVGRGRVITDTATDHLHVSPPFPNAPAAGNEYQIRNTAYDVLPLGWGFGIHHHEIDVASFELVRDKYLPLASHSWWVAGETEDLFNLIQKYLCEVYGILIYVSRQTGKITCGFVNPFPEQDTAGSYQTIGDSSIIDDEPVQLASRMPATDLEVSCRAVIKSGAPSGIAGRIYDPGETTTIHVCVTDVDGSAAALGRRTISIDAPLHNVETIEHVVTLATDRMMALAYPVPEYEALLDARWIPLISAGDVVWLTVTTLQPFDPYANALGFTLRLARVLSTAVEFGSPPGLRCKFLLYDSTVARSAQVAPACVVTAKGGVNPEYFTVELTNFNGNWSPAQDDWTGFAAGDLIELRDRTGALKEAETIESFGTNEAATTALADTARINVVGAIASAIAAGDYVTLAQYVSATVTAHMQRYAYYADATETLDADSGNTYA